MRRSRTRSRRRHGVRPSCGLGCVSPLPSMFSRRIRLMAPAPEVRRVRPRAGRVGRFGRRARGPPRLLQTHRADVPGAVCRRVQPGHRDCQRRHRQAACPSCKGLGHDCLRPDLCAMPPRRPPRPSAPGLLLVLAGMAPHSPLSRPSTTLE